MAPACAQEALRRSALCTEATAIFVLAPSYLHRVAWEYGDALRVTPSLDPVSGRPEFDRWLSPHRTPRPRRPYERPILLESG